MCIFYFLQKTVFSLIEKEAVNYFPLKEVWVFLPEFDKNIIQNKIIK